MAKNKKPIEAQITLVGQSDSGKTHLLGALLGNINSVTDLRIGPDAIASVGWTGANEDPSAAKLIDQLKGYATNIVRGKVLDNSGTDDVTSYPCRLSFRKVIPRTQKKSILGTREIAEQLGPEEIIKFNIVDGKGGDIAPSQFLDPDNPQNEEPIRRQREYRDRLNESVGAVVIMPMDKEGFKTDLAGRLVDELLLTIEERKTASDLPKLKNIAFCFTKYDELFGAAGANAAKKAADLEIAIRHLRNTAMVRVFEPLFSLAERDPDFNVGIFPVSTFGFVNGDGAANFYDLKDSPGLLTRAVSEARDWKNPEIPHMKDHFPFELNENLAETLWRPFNIAPPLLFALTGKITGPLCLYPEEVLAMEKQ